MYKNAYYKNDFADVQNIIKKEKINQINSSNKDENINNEELIDVDYIAELKLKY